MLLGLLFIISSCGGGGGSEGGGGGEVISYNGPTTQASLSDANASHIFSVIWNGGSSSGAAALPKAPSIKNSKKNGIITIFKQLKNRSLYDGTGFAAQAGKIMRATSVDMSYQGAVSGTLR